MTRFLAVLLSGGILAAQRPPVEEAWELLAKGERQQAIGVLHRIIGKNPRDADARLLLGSVLTEDGDRTESIVQLTEAVRLRPQSAEGQNALGEALLKFAAAKDARGPFEKAVRIDPNLGVAQANLGQVLFQAGEPAEAAAHLDRAIALFGKTADAAYPTYLRAKLYTAAGEAQKAAAGLSEAVSVQPDFAEAWSDLGEARRTLLDAAGALAAFERAVQLSPDDAVAQTRLGAEYLSHGRPHDAVPHLEQAARIDPGNQSTLYSLQLALRKDGRPEEAEAAKQALAGLLRQKDKADQNMVRALEVNNQGASLEKVGNLRAALEKYRAALGLYPEHVGIRVNLATALLRLGQWTEGVAEMREALRRDPDNAVLRKALAQAEAQAPAGTGGGRRD